MRKLIAPVAAFALAGVLAVAGLTTTAAASDAVGAPQALAASTIQFDRGNYSSARNWAQAAIRADGSWGLAHAVLARSFLALGDGVAAEAELGRAKEQGFDMARGHQLLADAYLLQGQADRAIDEAGKTDPRYAGYATRVIARALAVGRDFPGAEAQFAKLLAANPNDAAGWRDLGRTRLEAGDLGGAIAAAARAVQLAPNDTAALTLRAELVRQQFGLVAALPWFEAALKRDAYFVPALIQYAATLGEAGRYQDMLTATRHALMARPESPDALYLQAVMAARAGNLDLARALLTRTKGALGDMAGARLLAGILDYAGGADQQAIAEWHGVVAAAPMNLTVRKLLGAAQLRSGDTASALDTLKPLALRGDADSYTLLLAARAFERQGARDWSTRFLDRAAFPGLGTSAALGTDDDLGDVGGPSTDPVMAVARIRALVDAKQVPAALAAATALVKAQPGAADGQVLLGDLLMVSNRAGEAVDAYRHAADLRFDRAAALKLVDALDRAGRRSEAASVLATWLSQNPQDVIGHRLAGHWQVATGQWDDAVDTLEDLRTRLGDLDPATLAELAQAYAGGGDLDTALVYARGAYRLAPMNPAVCDTYGWVLYNQDKDDQAGELFDKAVAIAPAHAGIRWHRAQWLADAGRSAEAKADIAAALADPGFTDRAAAQKLLAALG